MNIVLQNIIEQLNLSVFILIAIFVTLIVVARKVLKFYGQWETKQKIHSSNIDRLQQSWNNDIPYIKEKVGLLFAQTFTNSVYRSNIPAHLTNVGEKIFGQLKVNEIIHKNKDKLKKLIEAENPKNTYDLQQACFLVIEKNMSEILTSSKLDIAKNESAKYGIPLDHTLTIFAILLRDILLKEKGWNIFGIDKPDTKNKSIDRLVSQLKKYYKEKEINSKNPRLPEKYKGRVRSSAVQVGYNYATKDKIAVISIDRAVPREEKPALEDGYRWYENTKHHHWYRTIMFVAGLQGLTNCEKKDETATYFAHLCAIKYKLKNAGKRDALRTKKLWDFCIKEDYLKGELEILKPDIIWLQGPQARGAFVGAFNNPKKKILKEEKNSHICIYKTEILGKKIIVCDTPHPTSVGRGNILGTWAYGNHTKVDIIRDTIQKELTNK